MCQGRGIGGEATTYRAVGGSAWDHPAEASERIFREGVDRTLTLVYFRGMTAAPTTSEITAPVRLRPSTKGRIERLKLHRRETMDDVVTRLLDQAERLNVRPGKRESAAETGK